MSEYDVIILSSKMSDNYCSENKKEKKKKMEIHF